MYVPRTPYGYCASNLYVFNKEEKCTLLTNDDERIEINLETRGGSSNTCSSITLSYADVHYIHFSIQLSPTQKAELLLAKS